MSVLAVLLSFVFEDDTTDPTQNSAFIWGIFSKRDYEFKLPTHTFCLTYSQAWPSASFYKVFGNRIQFLDMTFLKWSRCIYPWVRRPGPLKEELAVKMTASSNYSVLIAFYIASSHILSILYCWLWPHTFLVSDSDATILLISLNKELGTSLLPTILSRSISFLWSSICLTINNSKSGFYSWHQFHHAHSPGELFGWGGGEVL